MGTRILNAQDDNRSRLPKSETGIIIEIHLLSPKENLKTKVKMKRDDLNN
jgi:hypothetical protein